MAPTDTQMRPPTLTAEPTKGLPLLAKVALCAMARWVIGLIVLLCAAASDVSSASGQGIDREYKLKAAYLYKFATYIKWPKEAFDNATSPFVIGVLGPDPVGAHLKKIAQVKLIDGRMIVIRNYQLAEEIRTCHVLFMSRSVDRQIQQNTIKLLAGRSVLCVGETPDFARQGGVIDFVVQDNRIHIIISKSAYERESLEISAKLLRITTVVN